MSGVELATTAITWPIAAVWIVGIICCAIVIVIWIRAIVK